MYIDLGINVSDFESAKTSKTTYKIMFLSIDYVDMHTLRLIDRNWEEVLVRQTGFALLRFKLSYSVSSKGASLYIL